MESNFHQEESVNSSEEVEQDNSFDLGLLGRAYECVYCKRGFDSAQALGGHMNIHRKDKSRNKPASRKPEVSYYTGPRLYQQIPESRNDHFEQNDHHGKYATRFQEYAATSSATRLLYGSHNSEQQIYRRAYNFDRDTNTMIPGDCGVGLEFTPLIMEDLEKNTQAENNSKEDLDLELRLGYDS